MKKKEILKLIGMNRIINRNENLLTMTRKRNISIDIERIFPDIRELKDEFKVLQDELKEALKETEECKNYIKTSDCNHEVRLSYDDRFGGFTVCAFCKEKIPGKGWGNWSLSSNRNKYCVNLYSKHQYEEELDDIPGYEIEQAYEIVENILKTKEDDEQVDLVQEFKKLNLPYCTINEEKKIIKLLTGQKAIIIYLILK